MLKPESKCFQSNLGSSAWGPTKLAPPAPRRYDGVVRALRRTDAIDVILEKYEVVPPVLQCEATALRDYAGAKAVVVAVDERARVPLWRK